jgi:hypothetical protein
MEDMTMLNDKLVLLGVAGLAAAATAGWMRTPQALPASATAASFQPPAQESLYETPQAAAPSVLYATAPVRRFSTAPATPARAVRSAPVAYDDRGTTITKARSKKASAAIIGGSAAAGAAIGGLAGGGKGAIIGAIAGAGAGTVYDRMTYKKQAPATADDTYGYRNTGNTAGARQGRSTMQSAAIIGGGAAAGAAIGGAAGGGKGAAIGAVTGGAAGYVYDRMTRNR